MERFLRSLPSLYDLRLWLCLKVEDQHALQQGWIRPADFFKIRPQTARPLRYLKHWVTLEMRKWMVLRPQMMKRFLSPGESMVELLSMERTELNKIKFMAEISTREHNWCGLDLWPWGNDLTWKEVESTLMKDDNWDWE